MKKHDHAQMLLDALALVVVEHALAQPDGHRGDFDQLVVFDKFQGKFQRHLLGRNQMNGLIRAGRTDIRQFFLPNRVHYQIISQDPPVKLPDGMKITWLGHATFIIQGPDGKRYLIDPFIEGYLKWKLSSGGK